MAESFLRPFERMLDALDRTRLLSGLRGTCALATAVALAYLVPALLLLGDYGPTYDAVMGEYPYGERLLGYLETGDERFLDLKATQPAPRTHAPHPNFDVQRFPNGVVFPVGGLLSAIACRVLWTEWRIVPALSAHFLPSVLLAAVTVAMVTAFASSRWGTLAGVVAGTTLFLTPSFFGHSFNNPKDVPECCFYTCAVLVAYRAMEERSARLWLVSGGLAGLALAQKANALFLPVQLGLFWSGAHLHGRVRREPGPSPRALDVALLGLGFLAAYLAVSPAFWSEPLVGPARWLGRMIRAGNHALSPGGALADAKVSCAALGAVLTTTPVVVLLLAACGLLRPDLDFRLRWFLLVSIGLPVGRNLLPGMRTFEGTRHFLEFLPILCLAAGAGAAWLQGRARPLFPRRGAWLPGITVGLVALGPPAWAVVATHPNQVTFTNLFSPKPLADSWANSYWQGMGWLGAHAGQNARVFVPSLGFIALASAPVRLRGDVSLSTSMAGGAEVLPAYVMHLSGGSSPFDESLELSPLEFEVRSQGHSLLHIHRLEPDARGVASVEAWKRQDARRTLEEELWYALKRTPELLSTLRELRRMRLGRAETLARLRELLPRELYEKLATLLQADSSSTGVDRVLGD